MEAPVPRSDGTLAWDKGEVESFRWLSGIVIHGAKEVPHLGRSVEVDVRED